MARTRPAAGGGRWVEVDPERLPAWLDGFRRRHGDVAVNPTGTTLVVAGFDGAIAELHPPPGAPAGADLADFVAYAQAPRRVGLLLARRSAAAVGIAYGEQLVKSKVDSWYVQGRTAAGGQSQQRFARRRANQAAAAAAGAADLAARLLGPETEDLAALVTGGDRPTLEAILSDRRLSRLAALRSSRHLDVPTPNLAVLRQGVRRARAVLIHVRPEPGPDADPPLR